MKRCFLGIWRLNRSSGSSGWCLGGPGAETRVGTDQNEYLEPQPAFPVGGGALSHWRGWGVGKLKASHQRKHTGRAAGLPLLGEDVPCAAEAADARQLVPHGGRVRHRGSRGGRPGPPLPCGQILDTGGSWSEIKKNPRPNWKRFLAPRRQK